MAFDIQAARKAGYNDDEILDHLTATRKFDITGAVNSGYSKQEIIDYLSTSKPIPEKPKSMGEKFLSGVNKATQFATSAMEKTGIPQAIGGVVGAAGAVAGGVTGLLGQSAVESYKKLTGKSEGAMSALSNIASATARGAKETAKFGYQIGKTGTEAAAFGAAGRIPNIIMAAGQGYQGYKDIKEGWDSGDSMQMVKGGAELGMAALGAKSAVTTKGWILNDDFVQGVKNMPKSKAVVKQNIINKKIAELETTYEDIAAGTMTGKRRIATAQKVTEMKNRAGTEGRTPQRVLAQNGIIPGQKGSKLDTIDQANKFLDDTAPLQKINKEALKEVEMQTAPKNLDMLRDNAVKLARTEKNIDAGVADDLEKEIISEFEKLKKNYNSDTVTISKLNDIKSARWGNTKFNKNNPFMTSGDKLKKDADYIIGKTAQKEIEKTATEAGFDDLAQLNREIGDRLDAAEFLASLDNRTVKGGRLAKYTGMIIGSSAGNSLPGKVIGALGGNAVADMLISTSVAGPVKRLILKNLELTDPVAYTQAIQWLEKQGMLRQARLALPAPKQGQSYINQGRAIPTMPANTSGKLEYTGGETAAGKSY